MATYHCVTLPRCCRETILWCLEQHPHVLLLPPCCSFCCLKNCVWHKTPKFAFPKAASAWLQGSAKPYGGTLESAVPTWGSPHLSARKFLRLLRASTSPSAPGRGGEETPNHSLMHLTSAWPVLKSTQSRSDLKGMQLSRYSELMELDLQISDVHWMSIMCTGIKCT